MTQEPKSPEFPSVSPRDRLRPANERVEPTLPDPPDALAKPPLLCAGTRCWSRPLAQQPRDTKEPEIQKRRTTRTSLSVDSEPHIRPPPANYPIANRKPEATEFTGALKSRHGNTAQPRRQPRHIERGGREEWLRWRRPWETRGTGPRCL